MGFFTVFCVIFLSIFAMLGKLKIVNPSFIFSLSLLAPVLVFRPEIGLTTYLFLALASLVFFFGNEIGFLQARRFNVNANLINPRLVYLIFVIATLASMFSLNSALKTVALNTFLVGDARALEISFGGSTVRNYLMFMLMIVPSLLIAIRDKTSFIEKIIILLCFLQLPLIGIKSTTLFATTITFFSWYIYRRPSIFIVTLSIFIIFLLVVLLFVFVNMANKFDFIWFLDLLRGYIASNYENLDLELSSRNNFLFGKYTFFFITKLFDPEYAAGGFFVANDLFLHDENYNMGTTLREFFVDFGYLGTFVVLIVLSFFGGFVYRLNINNQSVTLSLLLSIFLTACTFAFFANQFIRLQFIWLGIVVILLMFFSRLK